VRLSSVLQVIYLIFNEGYSVTSRDDWIRPAPCKEALRPGLAVLVPHDPKSHAPVAFMEIQASRDKTPMDESYEPILLLNQDPVRMGSAQTPFFNLLIMAY
jgi:RNA polymerase sigma-70 factor, ECF subfamily